MRKNNWFLNALDLTEPQKDMLLRHIVELRKETDKKVEDGLLASKAAIEAAKVILKRYGRVKGKKMDKAQICSVCNGKGILWKDDDQNMACAIANTKPITCHGCGGHGWVQVQLRDESY